MTRGRIQGAAPPPPPFRRRVRGAAALLAAVGALTTAVAVPLAFHPPGEAAAVERAPVVGHVYRSVSVQQDGSPMALFADTQVWLSVDRTSLSVSGDCNSMGATVRVTATHFRVVDIAQTQMGCSPAEREERDEVLLKFLGGDPAWQLIEGRLVLTQGTTTITFERDDRPPPLPSENPARAKDLVAASLGTGEYQTWPQGHGESWRGPFLRVDVVVRDGRPYLTMRARCRQLEAPITIRRSTLTVAAPRKKAVRCSRSGSDETLSTARPFFRGEVMWHLDRGRLTLQRYRSTLTLRVR